MKEIYRFGKNHQKRCSTFYQITSSNTTLSFQRQREWFSNKGCSGTNPYITNQHKIYIFPRIKKRYSRNTYFRRVGSHLRSKGTGKQDADDVIGLQKCTQLFSLVYQPLLPFIMSLLFQDKNPSFDKKIFVFIFRFLSFLCFIFMIKMASVLTDFTIYKCS